tara:strand:- start:13495 stop:13833 length:339 start_codon:yes stop_codon:yes gene_type:complete
VPKNGKKWKKGTKHEVTSRITEVYGLLASGSSRQDIVLYCAENFDISDRQVDNYISRARKQIEKDCELSRPAFLAECMARLRTYEKAAMKRGHIQVAVNSVRLQAELIGLAS